jgi:hypothetical protein
MTKWIAERKLLYALKGSKERKDLTVRISQPYLVESGSVNFTVADGTGGCSVEFQGIDEDYLDEVYGADLLQALQLATDIEPTLRRLSKKYDLYFPSGEPYFDSEENEYSTDNT